MIKVRGNRVLIKANNEQTPSGIIIPECVQRKEYRQRLGEVKSVPKTMQWELSIGDTVLFDDYGEQIDHEGEKLTFVDPQYIYMVME